jgi:hypothetical protein
VTELPNATAGWHTIRLHNGPSKERSVMADKQEHGGIAVSTAVKAGRIALNHAEGVVVSTAVKAGRIAMNHAEGLVVAA